MRALHVFCHSSPLHNGRFFRARNGLRMRVSSLRNHVAPQRGTGR